MASYAWAKIYCDVLRHPLVRDRPDCDKVLLIGLILEAKEHTEDGVIRKLTATSARGLCHIKASTKRVQEAIDYFVTEGWLIPHPDQAYEVKDFISRQGRTDTAEAQAERSKKYYESHREIVREKRKVSRAFSRETVRENVRLSHVEVEEEEERDQDKNLKALSAAPTDALQVFNEWKRVFGKNGSAIFTPEREKKVKARLKDGYTVERLFKAIRGCKASPHHSGQNDTGTVYDDLELICRDGKHVETFEGFEDRAGKQMPKGPLQISEQSKTQAATPGRKFV